MANQETPPRNELRDWVKANAPLVTVTGVMLAAALFSRNLGPGKAAVWLSSCFIFLALVLLQEMFETFPPPSQDSVKLSLFKWILGSAAANLGFYWMLIVYKAYGTFFLGVVAVILGLSIGEWLVKRFAYFRDPAKPKRKLLGATVVVACGLAAAYTANFTIPRVAPGFERDFLGVRDSVIVGDTTVRRGTHLPAPSHSTAPHESTRAQAKGPVRKPAAKSRP